MSKRVIVAICVAVAIAAVLLMRQHSVQAQVAPVSPPANGDAADRALPVGEQVTVYYRGDASGASFRDRGIDMSSLVNVSGTLHSVDARWVYLTTNAGANWWIPVGSVAAIESNAAANPNHPLPPTR